MEALAGEKGTLRKWSQLIGDEPGRCESVFLPQKDHTTGVSLRSRWGLTGSVVAEREVIAGEV